MLIEGVRSVLDPQCRYFWNPLQLPWENPGKFRVVSQGRKMADPLAQDDQRHNRRGGEFDLQLRSHRERISDIGSRLLRKVSHILKPRLCFVLKIPSVIGSIARQALKRQHGDTTQSSGGGCIAASLVYALRAAARSMHQGRCPV